MPRANATNPKQLSWSSSQHHAEDDRLLGPLPAPRQENEDPAAEDHINEQVLPGAEDKAKGSDDLLRPVGSPFRLVESSIGGCRFAYLFPVHQSLHTTTNLSSLTSCNWRLLPRDPFLTNKAADSLQRSERAVHAGRAKRYYHCVFISAEELGVEGVAGVRVKKTPGEGEENSLLASVIENHVGKGLFRFWENSAARRTGDGSEQPAGYFVLTVVGKAWMDLRDPDYAV